ncbi:hypothetical protein [Edaphobacter sp.]|uniref:hypothetical protein n=1 Tax=Edaphobacter sp. TaxID=1934404 RepID=UPI002DB594E6|nr:hypothetical protein [Edaphobacter sp.]HEU5342573.1 hypothetical protein [Edaphobacter sp.]
MAQTSSTVSAMSPSRAATRNHRWFAMPVAVSLVIVIAVTWAFGIRETKPLFTLRSLVGPTTQSLLHGGGLTVCTEVMGTPGNPICFHSARMPIPTLVVALGISLLGNHYLRVAFFKALLLLFPLELAMYLAWRRMPDQTPRRITAIFLLLAPFAVPAFLACVVNMQVEEGYTYSLLALAVAILFFAEELDLPLTLLFAVTLDCLFLSKSSMAPAVIVLLIGYLRMQHRWKLHLLATALILTAPVGWAIYQHHAGGRYSLGTSLDGLNLHKGNNAAFLDHYPPAPGETLDGFDRDLNRGLHFGDEWSFNDYHLHAAVEYMRLHPRETLRGDLRKLEVALVSIRKIGSRQEHGAMLAWEVASLVFFRLMLWTAILGALYAATRPALPGDPSLRTASWLFLALVAACLLPYIAGFAYTRHVSVLIYPAALMCCRMLTHTGQVSR